MLTPSNSLTLAQRAGWVAGIRNEIERGVGRNEAARIRSDLPNSGLHTRIIPLFEQMKQRLTKEINPTLSGTFKAARADYQNYLEERIVRMRDPNQTVQPGDPWFTLGLQQNDNKYIEASFKFQDLMKDIEVIIAHKIQEGIPIALQEVDDLLTLIREDSSRQIDQKLSTQLTQHLQELKAAIEGGKFEEAQRLLAAVRNNFNS